MSLYTTNKKIDGFQEVIEFKHPSNYFSERDFYDVSNLIVSFLNLSKRNTSKKIYPKGSKILFKDIDPDLQSILKQEFADVLDNSLNMH